MLVEYPGDRKQDPGELIERAAQYERWASTVLRSTLEDYQERYAVSGFQAESLSWMLLVSSRECYPSVLLAWVEVESCSRLREASTTRVMVSSCCPSAPSSKLTSYPEL